jgi:hypothetical protein
MPKQFNAYDFKRQFIDSQSENSFFKIMTQELNYYFFSHMHDVIVEVYTKMELISHFYDFFNYLTEHYNGTDVSRAYASYYQELSKKRTDIQEYVWSMFYTFSTLMESSAELRAIRFSVEKNENLDLIRFFQHIKNMVATVLSINFEVLVMDNLNISPDNLSQVFSTVYEKNVIKKMHLLNRVSSRANKKGIIAAELTVVMISDFVKERQKKRDLANKPKINFAEFFPQEAHLFASDSAKKSKPKLLFDNTENEEFITHDFDQMKDSKKRSNFNQTKKTKKKVHRELLV